MENKRNLSDYCDILEARREESSNFLWVSRNLNLALAVKRENRPTPKSLKQDVLESLKIQELIENLSAESGVPQSEIVHQIKLILDEIGFKRSMKIIRWLGYVLAKICTRICSGIYVNEVGINRLKLKMGNCPVIFAPSHRSYADFILMSYLLFTFDIEIPAIAAGMDFHGMIGMGTVLRNTGAFFMRRTYNDDKMYWDTFKSYVHNLITRGELPIEFFIEGTRSRSCKSLCPKYGLLSMMLRPFLIGEVADTLIVPINISYDRVLEEKLFAFELLGVPKPKESTSGFFKSLSIIKERYGNIYVDFCEPISVKEYFTEINDKNLHFEKPIHQEELISIEKKMISNLAFDVVRTQQNSCVISSIHLVSLILSNNLISNNRQITTLVLRNEIKYLRYVFENLGALVGVDYETLDDVLIAHKNLLCIDECDFVNLVYNDIDLSNVNFDKMKGHHLSGSTMRKVVPITLLQIYVNPCLHFLINCSLVLIILRTNGHYNMTKDKLYSQYQFLRELFSYEFVFNKKWETTDFEKSLHQLTNLGLIDINNEKIILKENEKLTSYICNVLLPFFTQYHCVCYHLQKCVDEMDQTKIMKNIQEILENAITSSKMFIHPYCLNLDSLSICLQSLTQLKVLEPRKTGGKIKYKVNMEAIFNLTENISNYTYFYKIPMSVSITSKL